MTSGSRHTTSPLVHPQAVCATHRLGAGTRLAAFAVVEAGAVVGQGCDIGSQAVIAAGAQLGDGVTVGSGTVVVGDALVEEGARLGAHVTLASSHLAPSRPAQGIRIGAGARVGDGAVVQAGIQVARQAVVEAGAVVTMDVPPYAIVVGNPAQIVGYVDTVDMRAPAEPLVPRFAPGEKSQTTAVAGVTLHRLTVVQDLRGPLSVAEVGPDVPFAVQRYFVVFDVPNREVRGAHAHRRCHQFLVALRGSVSIVVDDGHRRAEILLETPGVGLHLPPLVWGIQYKYSPEAILLVLASDHYDPADYLRDYEEFLAAVGRPR